jgi:hypothetical protein
MICPKCKAEYREGYTVCAECQVPLVEQLSEADTEGPEPGLQPVTIMETADPAYLLAVQSVLEEAGIEYFPRGELVQDPFGGGSMAPVFDTVAGPVEIQVRPEDAETARALIANLNEVPQNLTEAAEEEEEEENRQKPRPGQ